MALPFGKNSRVSEKLQKQSVDIDCVMAYTATCNNFYPRFGMRESEKLESEAKEVCSQLYTKRNAL